MVDFAQELPALSAADRAARQVWLAPAELLDSLPVALYLCGQDGRLLRYNQRCAELWGRSPVLPNPAERFCGFRRGFRSDGTPLDEFNCPVVDVLRHGRSARDIEIVGERPDGSRVNVVISIDAVRGEDGDILGALVCLQDLTQRKKLEQTVTRRMAEQAALYEFTDRLFRATTRHAVYDAALDAIIRALGCSRASILLFDQTGKMGFVAWRGLSQAYRDAVAGHSPWRPGDRNAQPVCIEKGATADLPPALKAVLERERIQGLAFIPLTVDGAVIGKFMTYYATPHRFDGEEIELAVTIARQLGFRIERLQSEEARGAAERALKSERELLRTIIDSAPVMITLFNPETGMLQVNRQFEQLLGWTPEPVTADSLMQLCFPDPELRTKVADFIEACGPDWMDMAMQASSGGSIETSWVNFRLSDGTRVGIGIEITDRKRVEAQQALLLGEMSHRLRNLFSVAGSVIDMSARNAHTPSEMAEAVHDRLHALTRAHALARPGIEAAPNAGERDTTLQALLGAIFAPYAPADAAAPFVWSGSDLPLGLDALSGLALLLHEFATNAAKHGALSRPGGSVGVESCVTDTELAFTWRETGGPALEGMPGGRGFGAYLADRVVKGQFGGRMTREWSSTGLTIRLWLPLDRLTPLVAPPLVTGGQQK
jgi:PAS domain S-box-containing protein